MHCSSATAQQHLTAPTEPSAQRSALSRPQPPRRKLAEQMIRLCVHAARHRCACVAAWTIAFNTSADATQQDALESIAQRSSGSCQTSSLHSPVLHAGTCWLSIVMPGHSRVRMRKQSGYACSSFSPLGECTAHSRLHACRDGRNCATEHGQITWHCQQAS